MMGKTETSDPAVVAQIFMQAIDRKRLEQFALGLFIVLDIEEQHSIAENIIKKLEEK